MRHCKYESQGLRKIQPKGYHFKGDRYWLFQIIYVSSGELVFSSNGISSIIGPGGIVILREGSSFELKCPRTGYQGVAFHALGDLPPAFRGQAECLRSNYDIQTLSQLMKKQLSSPGYEFALEFESLGRAMAWEAIRLSEKVKKLSAVPQTPGQWAKIAQETLDSNLYTAAFATQILESIPLCYRQISRHFAKAFNCSPKQYQLKSKIREAHRLLKNTDLNITTIAMELGFASSQHFATQFKALMKMNPSDCRKGRGQQRENIVRDKVGKCFLDLALD